MQEDIMKYEKLLPHHTMAFKNSIMLKKLNRSEYQWIFAEGKCRSAKKKQCLHDSLLL
ncbi:MAG: hypothetical protein ACJAQ0_001065 [Dasania sp.]|jgi:hypothetical protein